MRTLEVELPNGRTAEIQFTGDESPTEIQATIDVFAARNQLPADPTAGMGSVERGLAGMGRGMMNVGRQIGNIMGVVPDRYLREMSELDAPLMETTAGQVGNVLGELALTAPMAGGAVAGAGRAIGSAVPRLAGATTAAPIRTGVATGAAEGAIEGAILGGPGQRTESAAMGAGLGTVGGAAIPFVTRGFRKATPEAERLMGMGVDLTPGQMAPEGAFNQIEEAMTSYPIVGAAVTRARMRPQKQFSQAMIEQALPPGAAPVPRGELPDMLNEAYGRYRTAYDSLKGYAARPDVERGVASGFDAAVNDPTRAIGDDARRSVGRFLDNQLSKLRGKEVMSEDLLGIRSDLRSEASRLTRNQKFDEAYLVSEAEQAITQQIERNLPEDLVTMNRAIDSQYGKYKIAEDAIYRARDRDAPTPSQWGAAVAKGESSRGAYARGGGRMRPEVRAARDVFQMVSPATGARVATLGGLGALGATLAGQAGLNDPMAAAYMGIPLALLAGSRGGRRFATGRLPGQAALERGITQFPVFGEDMPINLAPAIRGALPVGVIEDAEEDR